MKLVESTFIDRLKMGENQAYRELYDRYYGLLCHAADRYLRDRFQAECVVENVIFNIWERRESIDIHTSVQSYLTMSVRNACINYLQSKYKRSVTLLSHLSDSERHWVESASAEALPTDGIVNGETIAEVLGCLGDGPCREVFAKSRLDGLTYKEIADEMGISVNTVKYHIKNALARLAKDYGAYLTFLAMFMPGGN